MPASELPVFRAVLYRDDEAIPRELTLPSDVAVPPSRIRIPSEFAGASAFDVFELVDESGWPGEARYRLISTVPRSTDDLPEHERHSGGGAGDDLTDPEPTR